jgi:hypothetical protein
MQTFILLISLELEISPVAVTVCDFQLSTVPSSFEFVYKAVKSSFKLTEKARERRTALNMSLCRILKNPLIIPSSLAP